ncbi:jg3216, partial [Pararge aegeria aegeria]
IATDLSVAGRRREADDVKRECDDANDAYTFAPPAPPPAAPAALPLPAYVGKLFFKILSH